MTKKQGKVKSIRATLDKPIEGWMIANKDLVRLVDAAPRLPVADIHFHEATARKQFNLCNRMGELMLVKVLITPLKKK